MWPCKCLTLNRFLIRHLSAFLNVSGVMGGWGWGGGGRLQALWPLTPQVCNLQHGECCEVYLESKHLNS